MTVKELIDQLRRFYPANAKVLVMDEKLNAKPVNTILLDENQNTVELIAD